MYSLEQEQSLIFKANAGDEGAFSRLYEGLFPGVYGYARSRLPTDQTAEDTVSTTFLAVVEQMGSFDWRGPGSFRAWVFRILRNQIADYYRHNGHDAPDWSSDIDFNRLQDDQVEPEQLHGRQVQRQRLRQAIGNLSPRQRDIIHLRYFGGLRNKEIARLLAINERTVSAYLSRALDALHDTLSIESEVAHDG